MATKKYELGFGMDDLIEMGDPDGDEDGSSRHANILRSIKKEPFMLYGNGVVSYFTLL